MDLIECYCILYSFDFALKYLHALLLTSKTLDIYKYIYTFLLQKMMTKCSFILINNISREKVIKQNGN